MRNTLARAALERNGFTVVELRDTVAENKAFGARVKQMVERGEKPPHRAIQLIHGDIATTAMKNTGARMRRAMTSSRMPWNASQTAPIRNSQGASLMARMSIFMPMVATNT